MTFWIIAIGATLLAAAIIIRPLLSRSGVAAPRAAHDAQVFRDQLKELDRDLERGTVDPDQAEATKLEISRRLLAADAEENAADGAVPAPRAASRIAALVLVLAAPIGAYLLYDDIGAPGAKDQPFASRGSDDRPDQLTAESMLAGEQFAPPAGPDADDFRKLVTQLEKRLEDNPDDPQGVFLLGRSLMQLGRFADAWPNFERAIELNPQISLEARAGLAEGMILAAGGYISPEAEDALLQLVKRDPTNESARYYLGRLHVQANEMEYARNIWSRLLADSPADAPWVAPIQRELAQIGGAVQSASNTAPTRGPSEDDIAAAAELPEDERVDMVRTMVNGLAERIATEGGSVGEYVQLIRSWQVLREFDKAEATRAEALEKFAGNAEAAAQLATIPPSPTGEEKPQIFELPTTEELPQQAAPGPDAEDIAAASEMQPDDRQAMIRGMVQRLDDRLMANGGSADEWLRLVSSYSVLGDGPKAEDAANRARAALASEPGQLAILNAALNGAAPEPAPVAPASPGPTQEDIAAAQEMAPEDRQAMVRGMVSRLHNRLTTDGRVVDVNEWGKLMRAYKVLGDSEAIRAAYEEAVVIYDDDAISKAYLKEAALLNGVVFE
ncbi:MAG: c-type cytochrome biogenesis protein CcmI [Pikeienuella sp.]